MTFYSQLQFFGALIGTILFGSLSDYFGRKPISLFVLSFGVFINFASGLLNFFKLNNSFLGIVKNWKLLLITRFLIGLCIGGTIVVVCAFVMEVLLPEQRMALRTFFNWVFFIKKKNLIIN